ncbi:MAG: PIN domain-containing protein [Thermodesulfobacteriota bacterium]|jgi:predicted nucleic acid-binding protein
MKNCVLIDTSGWICFFARRGYEDMKKVISILLDEDRVAIAGPIFVELFQGARDIEEKQNIRDYAKGLHWLHVTDEHWYKSAELTFQLRRKGITSSIIDVLIAILAMDYQCTLLHKDSDFDHIARNSSLICYPSV